jgi:hypothetical protein
MKNSGRRHALSIQGVSRSSPPLVEMLLQQAALL